MKKSVLIIEDEGSLSFALKAKLTTAGFNTMEARDGEEGLKIALTEHPDIILLDILMPHVDGIEFLNLLRQDEWGKDAKVMVLTNTDVLQNVEKMMENNVFEYYIKGDTPLEDIVEKVTEMTSL